jgi:hypothetical protein
MRVRIKIQHDPSWVSNLRYNQRYNQRYWVLLPDGEYFPIFSGYAGQWYQLYASYMDYPCPEQAIVEALKYIYARYDKKEQWRKCRAKPQLFTFHARNYSRIRMPAQRSSPKPRTAAAR